MRQNIHLTSTGEDQHSEYKTSLNEWREAIEALAAFASAAGGTVLFGVLPDGSRAGVQISRGTLERLADQVKQHTEPPQYPPSR